jgi:ribosomal protein S18 acetylase RimI-like enzyme
MIRNTISNDSEALMTIVSDSSQFDAGGIAHVKSTLAQHLSGDGGEIWLTADDGEPVGVAYCAQEAVTLGTWNLLMLWIRKDRDRCGHGSALVAHVERELITRSARLLIVETSGLPEFEVARAFYSKCGFEQEARIKNFFAAGEDKLVYTKPINANAQ